MIHSRYTAAVTDKPWWLAGGIPASACVAAYRAVGAQSLEASYVNLANPGLYSLVPGTAPAFSSITGWIFTGNATSGQRLETGIIIQNHYTIIAKYNGASTTNTKMHRLASVQDGATNTRFGLAPNYDYSTLGSLHLWGSTYYQSTVQSDGVDALACNNAYRNGQKIATIGGEWSGGTIDFGICIGCLRSGADSYLQYFNGNVNCVAFYSATLNDYQVAELTRAMNAL